MGNRMGMWRHGGTSNGTTTPTYTTWRSMWRRCTQPTHPSYHNYGKRGIRVCDEWRDFVKFLADMGDRPSGMTLERRDSNANYSKENCRWATHKEQSNNRRNNHLLTVGGVTKTVEQWAETVGIKSGTISQRLCYGWSEARAVMEPLHNQQQRPQ